MLQPPLEKLVTEWLATRPRRPPTLKGSKQERIRAAQAAARDIVQAHFDVVFRGAQLEDRTIPPVGDPYIASFCGHSKDQAYERENGLLSQWRGYGGHGGYCIVFDTEGVDRLLDNEFKSHYYSHGFFGPVIYADDPTEVSKLCKPLLAQFQKVVSAIEAGREPEDLTKDCFKLISSAIRLKHASFKEESEIRLALSTYSAETMEAVYARSPRRFEFRPPKVIHERTNAGEKRRYIKLFENVGQSLPIKRVIVGPCLNQSANYEKVRDLVKDRMPIVRSMTPFVG